MSWPITTYNGQKWYLFDGQILMPVDPSTGAPILMLRPQGGIGQNIPAIEKGDPGKAADISTTINFTALDPTDPSPGSASFTQLSPATDTAPAVYRLNLAVRTGQPGSNGTTIIQPSDYDTYGAAVAKQMLVVDPADTTKFALLSQRIPRIHYPVTIYNAASGDTNKTLATVSIPANTYDFDYRIEVEAQTIVTGTGANVSVDLVARLGSETAGNDIGRCFGLGGTKDRLIIAGGSAANPADGWDKVTASSACTVHLRTEKQGGSDNYTTSGATTRFKVKVLPIL